MEKVKEESRRKSEELETLRRRVQENDVLSQNTSSTPHSRANSLQFPDVDIKAKEPVSYADDSYLMDFSKPASYQPSSEPPVVVRRRSLEPEPLPREPARPPVPPAPPRRSISRDHAKPAPPTTPAPAAVPAVPAAPVAPVAPAASVVKNPHSLLMEEIRKSAQQRMKKNEE